MNEIALFRLILKHAVSILIAFMQFINMFIYKLTASALDTTINATICAFLSVHNDVFSLYTILETIVNSSCKMHICNINQSWCIHAIIYCLKIRFCQFIAKTPYYSSDIYLYCCFLASNLHISHQLALIVFCFSMPHCLME